jgi:hypothetical protein
MKAVLLSVVPLLFFSYSAFCAEYLEEVESAVYQTSGTKQEIAKRAKNCMAQLVRNDEVRISDAASGTGMFPTFSGGGSRGHSSGIQGGPVFVEVDIEAGMIIANNRVDYKSALIANNVKSTMTFFAKDGRFKIRHTNLEYVQKATGYMHNTGYKRIGKWQGSGWKKAQEALEGVTGQVADCVQKESKRDNW